MNLIKSLEWRYATKKFDTSKKVSEENLKIILNAGRLAPTAFGFSPFKILVIENPELRKKLQEASFGQAQVVDASHLLVLVARNTTKAEDVDSMISLISEVRSVPVDALKGYNDYIKGSISKRTEEYHREYNSRQAYIALGFMLASAAALEIDACPMEGFIPEKYNEILGLKDYSAVVLCPIGYRSSEDQNAHNKKVRKPLDQMIERL